MSIIPSIEKNEPRYVWGFKAAVSMALLPCLECGATAQSPCTSWWNVLFPLGFVSHATRAVPAEPNGRNA